MRYNTTNSNWEDCKGCSMFIPGINKCKAICNPEYKDKNCPCQTCIIKMVCNSACCSYNIYQDRLFDSKRQGLYNE